ncbi:MAG TPA: HD-GYP domain-containing protein [Acidimicrobiales bacterium]|nr:HD-GYP domain-containing protein [Acidimicrobiales bacterium]
MPQPLASWAVSAGVYLGPIAAAALVALVLALALPSPASVGGRLVWWVVLLAGPVVAWKVTDRALQRYLPLAALLKMSMVFPDRAPARMSVALRAGTVKNLERQLADAKETGAAEAPSAAAERILALAAALNAHDRRTRGHSERVRTLAELIGRQLGLGDDDCERLRWSALLHDIGKLAVHSEVLNKPGTLTDEEFAEIRNHPLEGAAIAAPLAGWLGDWSNCIAEHHEKFDGSGYPRGLSGDEISLGGRIVSVADSYEVITAVRSYKEAATPEQGRAELTACSGMHFDPEVVRAFLEISVGKLRRTGGLLAWLGTTALGQRGPAIARYLSAASQPAAASVAVVAAFAVAGAQHGAFGGPISTAAVSSGLQPTTVGLGQCQAMGFSDKSVAAQIAVRGATCSQVADLARNADVSQGRSFASGGYHCSPTAEGPGSQWSSAWGGHYDAYLCVDGTVEAAFNWGFDYTYTGSG